MVQGNVLERVNYFDSNGIEILGRALYIYEGSYVQLVDRPSNIKDIWFVRYLSDGDFVGIDRINSRKLVPASKDTLIENLKSRHKSELERAMEFLENAREPKERRPNPLEDIN